MQERVKLSALIYQTYKNRIACILKVKKKVKNIQQQGFINSYLLNY